MCTVYFSLIEIKAMCFVPFWPIVFATKMRLNGPNGKGKRNFVVIFSASMLFSLESILFEAIVLLLYYIRICLFFTTEMHVCVFSINPS